MERKKEEWETCQAETRFTAQTTEPSRADRAKPAQHPKPNLSWPAEPWAQPPNRPATRLGQTELACLPFEPKNPKAFSFSFLFNQTDIRDPLVSDTVSLTRGPHMDMDPLTVDLVNVDQVNTDVSRA